MRGVGDGSGGTESYLGIRVRIWRFGLGSDIDPDFWVLVFELGLVVAFYFGIACDLSLWSWEGGPC